MTWAHISMDFITGLLTVLDRFSKTAHFRALPKLHSNKETEEAVLLHVLHLHGLTQYIVLDLSFLKEILQVAGSISESLLGFPSPVRHQQSDREVQPSVCGKDSSVSPLGPPPVRYDIPQLTPCGIHSLHCSSASMGTNRHISQSWRGKSMFRWPSHWIIVAILPGGSLEQPSFEDRKSVV